MIEPDLPCNQAVELVTDYLEDALAPLDRKAFEQHLTVCEGCVEHTQQIRATVDLLARLPSEQLPPEARDRLLTAFREQRHAPAEGGGRTSG